MVYRPGFNKKNIIGVCLLMVLMVPGKYTFQPATGSPYILPASPSPLVMSQESTDSVPSHIPSETAGILPKENVQGSFTNTSSTKSPATRAPAVLVSEKVQAENLLEQGYSVKDIAKELQLTRKEVRMLKRKLKKEEKAAIQQRKKNTKARAL